MDSKVDMGLGTTVEPCKWCGYCPEAEERSCSCCRTLRQAAIEAQVKNLRAWLADPKFPVKTERVYHPFGWATVEFLDLDGIFPTGEVSIGVGVIREVWETFASSKIFSQFPSRKTPHGTPSSRTVRSRWLWRGRERGLRCVRSKHPNPQRVEIAGMNRFNEVTQTNEVVKKARRLASLLHAFSYIVSHDSSGSGRSGRSRNSLYSVAL